MNHLKYVPEGYKMVTEKMYPERPILKMLDIPDMPKRGSTLWHINQLCRVMDYLGAGSIEHDYVKKLLEDRLAEHEEETWGKE